MIYNANDWWDTVDKYWFQLREILGMYLPMDKNEDVYGEILQKSLFYHVENLKESKDAELARYFHAAWGAAPDSPRIHRVPGWGKLCDLCSEDYVLYEDLIEEEMNKKVPNENS
jgi:hypothetical protein